MNKLLLISIFVFTGCFHSNSQKTKKDNTMGENQIITLGSGCFWLDNLRNKEKCDVYIFNTPILPIFFKPKKSVVIVLDYAYYYLSEKNIGGLIRKYITFFYQKYSLRKADNIVSISNYTKEETVKLFKIKKEKIKTIYIGFNKVCNLTEKKIDLPENYFLFVGVHKKRKNLLNMIKAFKIYQTNHKDHYFVIAGNDNTEYASLLKEFVSKEKISNVIFLGRVDDNELSYLYKKAFAFLFPTIIEGFGMPVLEAMNCGVPVIVSDRGATSEIGGDAALKVDPDEPEDIAEKMALLTDNKQLRTDNIEKGSRHSGQFLWEGTARELLLLINQ
jgi:glycosyltransferase involved in cell wall biosynthesis